MNREISLLDCTLRDGGYVNDWNFGYENLISMFERLVSSGIDIVEVGFLDERRSFDKNRSIMPNTDCVYKIYGNIDARQTMVVGMIDYGTCSINNLTSCNDSYLDGIRIIFKKHIMREAIAFCHQVCELGYKVFVQLVSITSYSDKELMELIQLVNELKPYGVSMVDTYGLLHQESLLHYFELLDKNVAPGISIGYHSHNNFQLGYANCIEVLKTNAKHSIIVDATLYGMGKSAGNTPIELLAKHLNTHYGKHYDINQILEAIDGNIMREYKKCPWGYNLFYYLAASNNCHPNYVTFLLEKHTLSIRSVNEILDGIIDEKKLLYDQSHIEDLYYRYQGTECDDKKDVEILKEELYNKNVLLLGPGKNIQLQEEKIRKYIERENPVILSINYIPGAFHVDYVFLCNTRRYIRLANSLRECKNKKVKVIATSNVTKVDGKFHYTLNNSTLLDQDAEIIDNSFIMLLKVLQMLDIKSVSCAGFDGYSETEENYYSPQMEYWFAKEKANLLNGYVIEYLRSVSKNFKVQFITDSYYKI